MNNDKKLELRKLDDNYYEEYAAYCDYQMVGYLKIQNGHFSVRCPNADGMLVCSGHPNGDNEFESYERNRYLNDGCKKIKEWMEENRQNEEEVEFYIYDPYDY